MNQKLGESENSKVFVFNLICEISTWRSDKMDGGRKSNIVERNRFGLYSKIGK